MRIKDQKRDGSMTIFVSLVMLLVASVLFTLLEAARFPGLDGYECDAVGRVGVCGISERDLGSV